MVLYHEGYDETVEPAILADAIDGNAIGEPTVKYFSRVCREHRCAGSTALAACRRACCKRRTECELAKPESSHCVPFPRVAAQSQNYDLPSERPSMITGNCQM
jgi:hypothetical protein